MEQGKGKDNIDGGFNTYKSGILTTKIKSKKLWVI